jgi:hypothetical protein
VAPAHGTGPSTQVAAGARAIQVFDSWGALARRLRFAAPYSRALIERTSHRRAGDPFRHAHQLLPELHAAGGDVMVSTGASTLTRPGWASAIARPSRESDPVALFAPPRSSRCVHELPKRTGAARHIFKLVTAFYPRRQSIM